MYLMDGPYSDYNDHDDLFCCHLGKMKDLGFRSDLYSRTTIYFPSVSRLLFTKIIR